MTDPLSIVALGGGAWLLKKLVSPSAELLGEELRAQFEGFLGGNRRRVLERAAAYAEDSAEEIRAIPLRLLLPILERSGYEDNEFLQERWAALLANACTTDRGEQIPPAFVTILSQLTPTAAAVVDLLPDLSPRVKPGNRWGSGAREILAELRRASGTDNLTIEDVWLALNVAEAAGLVEREPAVREDGIFDNRLVLTDRSDYRISVLGAAFVAAVNPPGNSSASPDA
jgi:hypothetical protein